MPRKPPPRDAISVHRLLARAESSAESGDLERAESLLRDGLAKYPGHCFIPMELGLLLDARGRHEEAEVLLTSAASNGDTVCLASLASFLARHDRHHEAVAHYDQVRRLVIERLEASSDDELDEPERWLLGAIEIGLAQSLQALGRVAQAEALFDLWAEHPALGADVRRLRGDDDPSES